MSMHEAGKLWNVGVKQLFCKLVIDNSRTHYYTSTLLKAIWTNQWNSQHHQMLEYIVSQWKNNAHTAELGELETKITFYTRELRKELDRLEIASYELALKEGQKELRVGGW